MKTVHHIIIIGLILLTSVGIISLSLLKSKKQILSDIKVVEQKQSTEYPGTATSKKITEKTSPSVPNMTKADVADSPPPSESVEESSAEEQPAKSSKDLYKLLREKIYSNPEWLALRDEARPLSEKEDELAEMYCQMTDYIIDVRDNLATKHRQAQDAFTIEVQRRRHAGENFENAKVPYELTREALEEKQKEAVGELQLKVDALVAEIEKVRKQLAENRQKRRNIENLIRAELGLPLR